MSVCSTPSAPISFEKNRLSGAAALDARHAIESASWIWHPDVPSTQPAILDFGVDFEAADDPLVFHVSADQRYLLKVDGVALTRGPDCGDPAHWPFATYTLTLAPGSHRLTAEVWWIGAHAPMARMTICGGFILKAEGTYNEKLTTGMASWTVAQCPEYSFSPWEIEWYQAVGDQLCVDGNRCGQSAAVPASVGIPAVHDPEHGVFEDKWVLEPASLPDQLCERVACGRVRAVQDTLPSAGEHISEAALGHPHLPAIQNLLDGTSSLTVPPNTQMSFLCDLDDYYCAYPKTRMTGGCGARVGWGWAEALFEKDRTTKGQRDRIEGLFFSGIEDGFISNGKERQAYETLWWRAGRYIQISIETGAEALVIDALELEETRYPLENESRFSCTDPEVERMLQICFRGLQCNAADKATDCPYYEQLMYVGDTRVQALIHYVSMADDRLARRCIELFNESRAKGCAGLTTARYPDRCTQWIPGFSLIWIWMVHDYYYWRDDPAFVAEQLLGTRSVLNAFTAYLNAADLLENIPHWVFFDWVAEWKEGYPPGGRDGISSLMNLLYILTLEKAAELESALGSEQQAAIYRGQLERTARAVRKTCWNIERNRMADDPSQKGFSEHAQILVILSHAFDEESKLAALAALSQPGLSKASIYFGHYLFEALFAMDETSTIRHRLEGWMQLSDRGFKTPPEEFENTRSDCHAWGSHPIFHVHTGVQGVRPASPGFKTVCIKPGDIGWKHTSGSMVHPKGTIETSFVFGARTLEGEVVLPKETTGTLEWKGAALALVPGRNPIVLPADS